MARSKFCTQNLQTIKTNSCWFETVTVKKKKKTHTQQVCTTLVLSKVFFYSRMALIVSSRVQSGTRGRRRCFCRISGETTQEQEQCNYQLLIKRGQWMGNARGRCVFKETKDMERLSENKWNSNFGTAELWHMTRRASPLFTNGNTHKQTQLSKTLSILITMGEY